MRRPGIRGAAEALCYAGPEPQEAEILVWWPKAAHTPNTTLHTYTTYAEVPGPEEGARGHAELHQAGLGCFLVSSRRKGNCLANSSTELEHFSKPFLFVARLTDKTAR